MMQKTLLLIKPDSTRKNHIGSILSIIEEHHFVIEELKMIVMDNDLANRFYSIHKGKDFYDRLIAFMISGKTVAAVLSKDNAVKQLRELVGATDYHQSKPETIRRIYGETITKNAVHASDSVENAEKEISIIFPENKK